MVEYSMVHIEVTKEEIIECQVDSGIAYLMIPEEHGHSQQYRESQISLS
jgi:hypothetical protein